MSSVGPTVPSRPDADVPPCMSQPGGNHGQHQSTNRPLGDRQRHDPDRGALPGALPRPGRSAAPLYIRAQEASPGQVAVVVTDALREHVAAFGIYESGLVFTSAIGTPLRASTMWTAWRAAARQVGTTASPHDLRHYFASVQISGGTSIKALQVLLGHKSAVETWDTYGHLMGDEDDRSRSVIQEWLLKTVHRLCTVETSEMRLRRSDGV